MSTSFDPAIAELQKQLKKEEQEVIRLKEMINRLCEFAGKPAMYTDAELTQTASGSGLTFQSDEFYGQPLARSVRRILEARKAANMGPATVREIYESLKEGGYNFETKNDANAMRGLRVSLSKNTQLFHKLPNGKIGLVQWYPKVAKARGRGRSDIEEILESNDSHEDNEPDSGDDDDPEEEAT